MNKAIRDRLARLERPDGSAVIVERGDDETEVEARARHLATHPQDAGRTILVFDRADMLA